MTISICLITNKRAVANTDVIAELIISTVYCSTNFGTVVGKSALNDAYIALVHKNSSTNTNGYDVWSGINVIDVNAVTNAIREKGAIYNREINVGNIKDRATCILSLKSRIFYREIFY